MDANSGLDTKFLPELQVQLSVERRLPPRKLQMPPRLSTGGLRLNANPGMHSIGSLEFDQETSFVYYLEYS